MREIDPGDAVPPGVAPAEPVPLSNADRAAKAKLEKLGESRSPVGKAPRSGSGETG
jgi:hypothetical protein